MSITLDAPCVSAKLLSSTPLQCKSTSFPLLFFIYVCSKENEQILLSAALVLKLDLPLSVS